MLDRKALLGILLVVACSKSTRTDGENGDGRGGGGAGPPSGGNAGESGQSSTGGASAGTGLGGASGTGGASGAAGDDNHGGEGNGGEGDGGEGPGGGEGTGGRPDAGAGGAGAGSGGVLAGAGGNSGGRSGAGGSTAGAGGAAGRPTVILLIDSSTSMFETAPPTTWSIMQDALVAPTEGVLGSFDDDIDFGLTIFRGSSSLLASESDPACATLLGLAPMTNAADAIGTSYRDAGDDWVRGTKWETPTGHAVDRVAAALLSSPANPRGKFIVLVTDGNPNTCVVVDPQCGQDRSVRAVQDARASGIRTLVVGVGDIVSSSSNSGCPPSARCGQAHLQDLANAGVNQPVVQPSDAYRYEACIPQQVLSATYSAVGGSAVYYAPTTVSAARTAFTSVFEAIVAGAVP